MKKFVSAKLDLDIEIEIEGEAQSYKLKGPSIVNFKKLKPILVKIDSIGDGTKLAQASDLMLEVLSDIYSVSIEELQEKLTMNIVGEIFQYVFEKFTEGEKKKQSSNVT